MRRVRFLFEVVSSGLLLLLGCSSAPRDQDPSPHDDGGAGGSTSTGAGGDLFPTTSSIDGEGGGPTCAGVCKEWKPAFYEELTMFWLGPSEDAPPCPDVAPLVGSEGYAAPLAPPHTCPSCSCSPAACAVPEHMHVSAGKCIDGEGASITWDSPAWGGSCTTEGAIAPGLMCNGEPCAQSLTIDAAAVEPCQPVEEGTASIPHTVWGLMARECKIGPRDAKGCKVTGEACVPVPPVDFTLCVHRSGDAAVPCPDSYPHRYVVFAGVEDTRSCKPCSCGDPRGAACSAVVQVFTDGACGALLAAATVSPGDPACVDLPSSGAGLGSKAATWMEQKPGSCAPSGGPTGGIVLSAPQTLCCETEVYKPPG